MTTRIVYADGPGSPRSSPSDVASAAGVEGPIEVLLGWTLEPTPWLGDPEPPISTVLAGYALAPGVNAGRITALPIRVSAVAPMIESDAPDVAVITAIPRGERFAFGSTVGWADVLARSAHRVVVEIDEDGPDRGGPFIEGNIVATITRPVASSPAVSSRAADEIDLQIGTTVASLLPDEPTLQFGPGGIGEGIARALDRPVSIWSGLVTDAMASLHDRGLLLSAAVTAYTWGGDPIDRLHASGMLDLRSTTITHDVSLLSSIPRFVGCNTAVQVGLDGSVNVERVGSRTIAAVGGHADFSLGASRSIGGLSIVAMRSTSGRGHSTIVPAVDVVSTPRSDIDIVVTEHGVADLRLASTAERAERLAAVAAPDHREALRAASGRS